MTPTRPKPPPRFEALFRYPNVGKRWKSAGVFATEAAASAALCEVLKDGLHRSVDRWVHRLPATPTEFTG